MAEIRYLNFDLLIERAGEGYRARVVASPAGQAAGEFRLPFSQADLEQLLSLLGRPRSVVRRVESPEMEATKTFGGRLFNTVFGGDVSACFRNSLDQANEQGAGLRIRLNLANAPDLADLPWEYLYDPTLNRFFSLSVKTPLVRYIDLPERIQPQPVQPPLRVLVMISSPRDYPRLNVEREWEKLNQALGDLEQRGLVALERLEEATLAALGRQLRQRLQQGEYHIFHFVGHGGFDERLQDGVLVLEDEERRGHPVSGQFLGTMLHDHRSLRLAVLNACEGARTSLSDPFAGVAQSLIQQGIPAVIAMQFEITDKAAITLTHEFYGAVADGLPIDAALADARKLIFADNNQMEWGTPVLYMRSPDGHIFNIAAPPAVEGGGRRDEELQRRLGDLYDQGRSYFWTEQWDKAIEAFNQVVALKRDYRDAASKLEEARRQKRLAELYADALRAYEARSWPEAIRRLEAVTALDPVYLDTITRLKEARRQKELADLYAEARRLREAQNWEGVVSVFGRITALDPKYPDPEGLLPLARRELAAIEQAHRLDTLYRQGLQYMDSGEWPQALKAFEEIQRLQAGYRETEKLLARARREAGEGQSAAPVSREEQELAGLYAQAQAHYQARRWREALDLFRRVQAVQPAYKEVQAYIAYIEKEMQQEQVRRSAAVAPAAPAERSVAPPKQVVAPAPPAVIPPAAPAKKDTSPVAIAALVLGVVNLCAWFLPICGGPLSVAGIIVGVFGMRSSQRNLAIIGIVLCVIGLILSIVNAVLGVALNLTGQF